MFKKMFTALTVTAVAAGGLMTMPAQAADQATVHRNEDGIVLESRNEGAKATGELLTKGYRAVMHSSGSKAWIAFDAGNVPLNALDSLGYETFKNPDDIAPAVLPSYQILIDPDGDGPKGEAFLVYEPYLQTGAEVKKGEWQTWNPMAGLLWANVAIPGLPTRDVKKTIYDIRQDNQNAVVKKFVMNVGSGNAGGDVSWDTMSWRVQGYDKQVHTWTSQAAPTPTPTATPTATPLSKLTAKTKCRWSKTDKRNTWTVTNNNVRGRNFWFWLRDTQGNFTKATKAYVPKGASVNVTTKSGGRLTVKYYDGTGTEERVYTYSNYGKTGVTCS